jgi:Rieske 2Fe-2S family protein
MIFLFQWGCSENENSAPRDDIVICKPARGQTLNFRTLPARYYTDPDLFREEIESFYFESWVCAGRAAAIPNAGDYFLREFGGESIVVVRDAAGNVRAHYNVCRHRGTRMCTTPQGNLERIQCPYHGWTYGLDGQLLGAPHMDNADFSREDY